MPDPLTSAQKQYGTSNFIDNNDADTPALTSERKVVDIEVTLNGNTYNLDNTYVKIVEYESPAAAPVTSNMPVFNYTRTESGFEDVNAFYHLSEQAKYVFSLGFNMLQNQQVLIDTHAEGGDDQSRHRFDYNYDKHIITHGEGGVDDAEDADVVIHEFGHALSFAACNDCNSGHERLALDEALCDYLAGSYSYKISDYRWKKIFSWDGQNPFFQGRDIGNSKTYPNDVSASSIYTTSAIFSGALADIMDILGKPTTDSLVLASLYNWAAGIKLDDAANLMILTDQELTNGRNYNTLCYVFTNRGLYNGTCEITANAGEDKTICLGDSTTLGQNVVPSVGGTIEWTPTNGLSDAHIANPVCSPDRTTTYTLTLKNNIMILSDAITINVQYCFSDSIGTSIKIYNTDRFYRGGDALIEVPLGTQNAEIEVFDLLGRKIRHQSNNGDDRLIINSSNLVHGTYIIRVKADEQIADFKLIKAKQ